MSKLDKDTVIEAIALKTSDVTWSAVARQLGCTPENLNYYRRKYADEILAVARQHLATDIPAIYRALSQKAQEGDVAAIKLVLEHLNLMHADSQRQAGEEVVSEFVARYYAANERVRAMVAELREQRERELEQRRKVIGGNDGQHGAVGR